MTKVKQGTYEVNKYKYHLETDQQQVAIIDTQSGETLSTLNNVLGYGGVHDRVSYNDDTFRITGNYIVSNLTDKNLPSGYPTNGDQCLLSVVNMGTSAVGHNTYRHIRLITPGGNIYDKTISARGESAWTNGGTSLQNTINQINSAMGDVNKLSTNVKELVGSVNEVNNKANNNADSISQLQNQLNTHNHDNRYVIKTGDSMTGDLKMGNGTTIGLLNSKGRLRSVVHGEDDNSITIGDSATTVKLSGNGDMLYNGKKVFTEGNTGAGSNLDADKLDGIDGSGYLHVSQDDTKQSDLGIRDHSLTFGFQNESKNASYWANSAIKWKDSSNKQVATIESNASGDVVLRPGGKQDSSDPALRLKTNNSMTYTGSRIDLTSPRGENIDFRLRKAIRDTEQLDKQGNVHDGGWGWFTADWNRGLMFGNWNDNIVLETYTDHVDFNVPPSINGRKIYMAEGGENAPSGDIPYGSVWISF